MADKKIFEQAFLGKLELKNRLIRSATGLNLADRQGHLQAKLYETYAQLAKGGVGAIITGFTSVAEDDQSFGGMARLSNDELILEHQKLVNLCHQENCPLIAQIALGEYACGLEPNHLNSSDIKQVVNLFVQAAVRAEKSGYDGVQIHAAHGFFLSRFISPLHNQRTDTYGKSPEKRSTIILDIIEGIRQKTSSLHLSLKINSQDYFRGGLTPEESLIISKRCAQAGIDSIEVSSNYTSRQGIQAGVNEAYFKDYALTLASQVDIPIILVGGHRSLSHMEKILREGQIAFLSLSRPLIREPDLPWRWEQGNTKPSKCISCNNCYSTPGHQCIFNLKKM
ncbi:MAG: NADH:flavin oxidoreductase [Desulfovibrionaceae bacterium]|nr:NADH:flavin oxidoreductase [Desulfovibrionaceae bacterium]